MIEIIGLSILGIIAGIVSGLLGIGGAVIIIPALVFFFGFNQDMAQGTTLSPDDTPDRYFSGSRIL